MSYLLLGSSANEKTTKILHFLLQFLVTYYTFIISQVKDCTISLQIVQLTAAGNFEEALSLCKLLPPEDSNLRAAKEDSIHIRFIAILD